jgi:hypothetical protein
MYDVLTASPPCVHHKQSLLTLHTTSSQVTGVPIEAEGAKNQKEFRITSCRHSSSGCLTVAEPLALLRSDEVETRFEKITGTTFAATEASPLRDKGGGTDLYTTLASECPDKNCKRGLTA